MKLSGYGGDGGGSPGTAADRVSGAKTEEGLDEAVKGVGFGFDVRFEAEGGEGLGGFGADGSELDLRARLDSFTPWRRKCVSKKPDRN